MMALFVIEDYTQGKPWNKKDLQNIFPMSEANAIHQKSLDYYPIASKKVTNDSVEYSPTTFDDDG